MSSSIGSSPDPITLESSPPIARTTTAEALDLSKAARWHGHASPSRSFILDPGDTRGKSPWRIHVTVEPADNDMASPDDSLRRSTKVPLYDSQLSSPAKRRYRKTPGLEETLEVKRPSRKSRLKAVPELSAEILQSDGISGRLSVDAPGTREANSGASSLRTRSERPFTNVTPRSKRLSRARQELGEALHEATTGHYDYRYSEPRSQADKQSPLKEVPGDLTVSLNEDFTIVSVDSLQSYKNRAHGILSRTHNEQPHNVGITSTSARRPPRSATEDDQIIYPDISAAIPTVEHATIIQGTAPRTSQALDSRHTTPVESFTPPGGDQQHPRDDIQLAHEPTEWRIEREAVSRQIRDANSSQIIVINDTTVPPESVAGDARHDDAEDGDIWQEEASRSMEEASVSQRGSRKRPIEDSPPQRERSPQLADFFADEVVHPRRSKIPRTWRRASGIDFTYSDSPEHPKYTTEIATEPLPSPLKRTGNSDGESGVLTPPTTDDERARLAVSTHQQNTSDLTEPDAAATQLEEARLERPDRLGARQTHQRSQSADEDRRMSRHTRPQQHSRRAADLSDVLQPESSPPKSPYIQHDAPIEAMQFVSYPLKNNIEFEPFVPKLSPQRPLNQYSPWRKSLFRASHIRGSPVRSRRDSTNYFVDDVSEDRDANRARPGEGEQAYDSFEKNNHPPRIADPEKVRSYEMFDHDQSYDFTGVIDDPMRSYEEDLKVESPLKVKVNFNDSLRQSSVLAATKTYPRLFDSTVSQKDNGFPTTCDGENDDASTTGKAPQPGLLSRITTSLWGVLVRPSGPSVIPGRDSINEPEFSPTLRARIRSRYGVVSSIHTWNMVHMRTLHRMVNSITSGKADSIIPASGPLPSYLTQLLNSQQVSVAGFEYLFDMQNAQIVFAFLQILVDPSLVAAMETGEIAFLGDASARRFRETDVLGRRGQDSPWPYQKYQIAVPSAGTRIDWAFVVRALGDALYAHEWEKRRHGKDAAAYA